MPLVSAHNICMIVIKIWEMRNCKGYSLRKLSKKCGISKTTLNDIENAKLSPTLAQLERIAAALDCQMWQLFDSPYNNVRDSGHFDKNVEIKVKNAKI